MISSWYSFYSPSFLFQDEREARETVKREQDEAYRLSLEADRKKVWQDIKCPFLLRFPFLFVFIYLKLFIYLY